MVAYNFMAQWAQDVESGQKPITIRDKRKSRHARVGEPLQLYAGMRTSHCRKLVDPDPICEQVSPILFVRRGPADCAVFLDGNLLNRAQVDYLIIVDGFTNRSAFFDFHLGDEEEQEKVLIRWGPWPAGGG